MHQKKHQVATTLKACCVSRWGSWSGTCPFNKEIRKHMGKCQKNITVENPIFTAEQREWNIFTNQPVPLG